MKNVIFFNTNKVWGGGEKWHFNMALALKDKGYNITLITYPNSDLEKKAEEYNIPFYSLEVNNLSFLNPFKRALLKGILKTVKPDAIFLNLPSDVKFCVSVAKACGIKNIIYRRGMPHPIKSNFINNLIYKKLDIIIANSEEIKRTVSKFIPELNQKIQIVFNGVNPLSLKPKDMSKPIRLGNLGRLVEQKGQHHLIEVARILKEKRIPFQLKIGGKGPYKQTLEKMIEDYSLEDEVELLGHVSPQEFLESIDLFLFPSYFEGSANALIESLQFGVPGLCFKMSSMPEVIQDDYNGFLIEPFNETQMADKIIELINNKDKFTYFQENALKTIIEKFNYHDKVSQIEEIINE